MEIRRWSRRCGPPLAAMLVMLTCSLTGYAQANRASITGTITDPQGAVVSGAIVTATNVGTTISKQATTSDDGRYSFGVVFDPGTYTVKVEMSGFKTATSEQIVLQIGDVREVNVALEPGGAGEVVTVTAEAPLVESETSSRGDVITGRQITELPLNGRNFTNFAVLVPGVTRTFVGAQSDATGFQGDIPGIGAADTPAARFSRSGGSNLSINGLRPSNNNFTLDGVDNNEGSYGQIAVFPPPDAIQEFKVETSVPSAEQGRGNGFITVNLKSGQNDVHGSLYYYHRNDFLDASPVFSRLQTTDPTTGEQVLSRKPVRRENEFGMTLGGPVWIPGVYNGREKTFFFVDYQGQRNKYPFERQNSFTSVPTARTRVGDFSEFAARDCNGDGDTTDAVDGPICDPLTGAAFPNGRIPENRQDPVARNYLNAFPLPNFGGISNNFLRLRRIEETINGFDVRIDHNISANHTLFGRFSFANQFRSRESFFDLLPAGFGAGEEDGSSRQIAIGDTYSFSPTVINDFRVGYSRVNIAIFECGIGGRCGISPTVSADLGIPNVNVSGDETREGGAGIGTGGNGAIEFTGDGGPFFVNGNNYHVADKVTVIRGNHTVKVGGDVRVRQINQFDGGSGPAKGFIGFDDAVTGNAQANILLGRSGFSNAPLVNGPFTISRHEYDVFVQDDWKVSPRLMLNLGLRYDLFTNPFERHNRFGNFDLDSGTITVATDDERNLVNDDRNNFGPRIGFAYALNENRDLVIRGGWGLLYFFDATDLAPLSKNPPNGVPFAGQNNQGPPVSLANGPPSQTPNTDPLNLVGFATYQFVNPNNKTPYVHQYNLTVQYQLSNTWVLDVGYQGASTRKLVATRNLGNGGNGLGLARDRNGVLLDNVKATENRGASSYNSLQVRVEKRFSAGLVMINAYTWSHTIDETAGDFGAIADARGQFGGPQNPLRADLEKGNSSFDIRHKFTSSVVYDIPFGQGKRFINTGGAVDRIVSGFQFNWITTWHSGLPYSVVLASDTQRRPDLIGDPEANVPEGLDFNPAAFAPPSQTVTNLAGKVITYGSAGRNILRGPQRFNIDASLFKNTAISETVKLQLGIEFFNLLNNVQKVVPVNGLNFNADGTVDLSNNAGRILNAYPQRQGQLRAKIIF
jgi:hypothetical protein